MTILTVYLGTILISLGVDCVNILKISKDIADKGHKVNIDTIADYLVGIEGYGFELMSRDTIIPFYNLINTADRVLYYNIEPLSFLTELKEDNHLVPMTPEEKRNYFFNSGKTISAFKTNLKTKQNTESFIKRVYINKGTEKSYIDYQINEMGYNIVVDCNGFLSKLSIIEIRAILEDHLNPPVIKTENVLSNQNQINELKEMKKSLLEEEMNPKKEEEKTLKKKL